MKFLRWIKRMYNNSAVGTVESYDSIVERNTNL